MRLLDVLLWTFRRSEKDVVKLYTLLSPVMMLATGGRMLNFGYWIKDEGDGNDDDDDGSSRILLRENTVLSRAVTIAPLEAQELLCTIVGNLAELESARSVVDVGSGLGAPAAYWKSAYGDALNLICLNINLSQLQDSKEQRVPTLPINATSTSLPFANRSVDRVVALESAQHFRPFELFVQESARILESGGLLVMAIPVLRSRKRLFLNFIQLGILALTWSSEHYDMKYVEYAINAAGFSIEENRFIGERVYVPLADYYIKNRQKLKEQILTAYPAYLEEILYRSILKMKQISEKGDIEYVLVKARKKKC